MDRRAQEAQPQQPRPEPQPRPQPQHVARAYPGRAKQFMPFATLRGYYDAVRAQERLDTPRRELQEEDVMRISRVLARIAKGSMVRVTYYDTDAYVTMQGAVTEIVPTFQWLSVVKTRISFEDILHIEIIG